MLYYENIVTLQCAWSGCSTATQIERKSECRTTCRCNRTHRQLWQLETPFRRLLPQAGLCRLPTQREKETWYSQVEQELLCRHYHLCYVYLSLKGSISVSDLAQSLTQSGPHEPTRPNPPTVELTRHVPCAHVHMSECIICLVPMSESIICHVTMSVCGTEQAPGSRLSQYSTSGQAWVFRASFKCDMSCTCKGSHPERVIVWIRIASKQGFGKSARKVWLKLV